jgi:hypothetical protein
MRDVQIVADTDFLIVALQRHYERGLGLLERLFRPARQSEAEQIADAAIEAAKKLGAKAAREAAEITMGRELTVKEWAAVRATWDRRWN